MVDCISDIGNFCLKPANSAGITPGIVNFYFIRLHVIKAEANVPAIAKTVT